MAEFFEGKWCSLQALAKILPLHLHTLTHQAPAPHPGTAPPTCRLLRSMMSSPSAPRPGSSSSQLGRPIRNGVGA